MKKNFKNLISIFIAVFLSLSVFAGCDIPISETSTAGSSSSDSTNTDNSSENYASSSNNTNVSLSDIPAYSSDAYVAINNNKPDFSESDFSTTSWEKYSPLDSLGRCGVAFANVGVDLMPTADRGDIGSVKPTGWHSVKYDIVDGKYLYNRCHLIGYQLAAENANKNNLITGTRYLNVTGMLPFENMVADYVKETNNHVLYKVTPIFNGNDLVAQGVQMEAQSVEDNGEGIEFNVFVYNVQPGITIDYSSGASALNGQAVSDEGASSNQNSASEGNNGTSQVPDSSNNAVADTQETTNNSSNNTEVIRGNSKSKIYHCPGQRDYENMADSEYLVNFNSEEEAINAGYRKAQR